MIHDMDRRAWARPSRSRSNMKYLLFVPGGYDEGDRHWPLMVFLHGSGEAGDDLELVKRQWPPRLVERWKAIPILVLAPQGGAGGWNVDALDELLDEVVGDLRVDRGP